MRQDQIADRAVLCCPAIDLSHFDFAGSQKRPEQHGGGIRRGQNSLRFDPALELVVQAFDCTAADAGAYGVVNAVSIYLERGTETFRAVHVEAAERLARQAQPSGTD